MCVCALSEQKNDIFMFNFDIYCSTVENGIKTVEMKEDGKLVSRKVNGKELLRLTWLDVWYL